MTNLADKVKRYSRNLLLPALAAASLSNCDTILGPKNKNEAPETEILELHNRKGISGNNFVFKAEGRDPDGKVKNFEFRIEESEEYKNWNLRDPTSRNRRGSENSYLIEVVPLPIGDYTLEVRAIDNKKYPDLTPARAEFSIRPFEYYYIDDDNDGFGINVRMNADAPRGEFRATVPGDCNDHNPNINPLSEEIADGIDNDCNRRIDEGLLNVTPTLPPIITEPITVSGDSTRVFRGSTNGDLVSFIDEDSEDGKAEVEVLNQNSQREVMDVNFYDIADDLKYFTAVDPNDYLAETMLIAPHNSLQTLRTAPKNRGRVLMQVIDDEETARAWYKFETNPQLRSNPFRRYEYTETIDEDERVERRDKNLAWIRRVDKVNEFIEIIWAEYPFKFEELAPDFDPYVTRDNIQARRWDVYRRSYGTEFTPERIEDIVLVPSNFPSVEIADYELTGRGIRVTWDTQDGKEYEMPFDLPQVDDLTVLLGKSRLHDLTRTFNLLNKTTQQTTQTSTEGFIPLGEKRRDEDSIDLPSGEYSFFIGVTDEVGNTSFSDTLGFRIEPETNLPETPAEETQTPSPDLSDKIVFVSESTSVGSNSSISITNLDGSNVERLTGYNNFVSPIWSPAGERISFSAEGRTSRTNVMDMRTREFEPFSIESEEYSWSHDGTQVVYVRRNNSEIYIGDMQGISRLIKQGLSVIGSPDWSIDDKIVVSGVTNKFNLITMNSDGSNETNLTGDKEGFYFEPKWSPDGRRIAFTNQIEGEYAVGVINSDGSYERMLTGRDYNHRPETEIKWSPDGRKIGFLGNHKQADYGHDLYVIDLNSGEVRNLTEDSSYVLSAFSWSPDGREIIYDSDGDLFIVNSNGSNKRNITDSPNEFEYSPNWSPF